MGRWEWVDQLKEDIQVREAYDESMKDIGILGGGIAGLNTALRLLKKGHAVTLYEKQKGVIDKVCGEGILPFGVQMLDELGLTAAVAAEGRRFFGLTYTWQGKTLQAGFPDGVFGIGIDRGKLDPILRNACLAHSNFTFHEGVRESPETVSKKHDFFLGADGVQGKSARWTGRKLHASPRIGARCRLQATPPDRVTVHFFKEGEIYLTPTAQSTTSVAFLLNRRRLSVQGKDLRSFCEAMLREAFPQYAGCEIEDFATRGNIAVQWKGPQPQTILLGDALAAFDPISGAGMSFSLLCGKAAAEHLGDVDAYYRSMKPAIRAIGNVTHLISFFSGGGIRTGLMFRQLQKTPALFQRLIASHNGRQQWWQVLDWQAAKAVLRV